MPHLKQFLSLVILIAVAVAAQSAQAQIFFEADWLFWSRNNDSDTRYILGPDAVSSEDADFGFESGYRISVGTDWISASFSQVNWDSRRDGLLADPFALDDTATNAAVFPAPPVNMFGVSTAVFDASALDAAELPESEHFEAGSAYSFRYNTTLDDFELNLGTNFHCRPIWWALGWRHLELHETSGFLVTGVFNARDVDDGAVFGDDPNDALAHASLIGAGFTLFGGGANGYAAYDPTDPNAEPVTMSALIDGNTNNDLDGLQGTLAGGMFTSQVVSVEGFLKAGVYHNRIRGSVQETLIGRINDDSIYRRTLTDDKTTAAFVGGAGSQLVFWLTEYATLRAGYEVLLITNVALGPDQPQGVRTNVLGDTVYRVQTEGVFFSNGGHVGLELRY